MVEVHLYGHGIDVWQEARRLALVANVDAVRPVGNNSASRVVELLGPRLGAIAMRPRIDVAATMPTADPAVLEALAARLDEEVDLRERALPRMLRTRVNVAELRTALLEVAG